VNTDLVKFFFCFAANASVLCQEQLSLTNNAAPSCTHTLSFLVFLLQYHFLFPKVKLQLKGARFDKTEEIQKAVTDQLNKIPAEDFSNAMNKLETRANLCITSNILF
jgi:hypothetical protein